MDIIPVPTLRNFQRTIRWLGRSGFREESGDVKTHQIKGRRPDKLGWQRKS